MLFTGITISPLSTPHISITTAPISTKFAYFMSSIYTSFDIKFEQNQISSLQDMRFRKLSDFHVFLLHYTELKQ